MPRLSALPAALGCLFLAVRLHPASGRAAAQPPAKRLALRALGGYALALGSQEYGEAVNSPTAPSGQGYGVGLGQGFQGALELGWLWKPGLELSLALAPRLSSETRESRASAAVTRSDKTTVNFSTWPVLVQLQRRSALSKNVVLAFGGGFGAALGSRVVVEEETVQTSAGGLATDKLRTDYEVGAAAAIRASLGLEWSPDRRVALLLGMDLLGLPLGSVEGRTDWDRYDEGGAKLASVRGASAKAKDLNVWNAALLAGLGVRF